MEVLPSQYKLGRNSFLIVIICNDIHFLILLIFCVLILKVLAFQVDQW